MPNSSPPTLIEDPTVINFQRKFIPLCLFHTLRQLETLDYLDGFAFNLRF